MKTNHDDPRLTAYLLGELDADERAELEAELAKDPEARQYLDELRQATELLATELPKEEAPPLLPSQRESILTGRLTPYRRNRVLTILVPALAASVVLAVGLIVLLDGERGRQITMDPAVREDTEISKQESANAEGGKIEISDFRDNSAAPAEEAVGGRQAEAKELRADKRMSEPQPAVAEPPPVVTRRMTAPQEAKPAADSIAPMTAMAPDEESAPQRSREIAITSSTGGQVLVTPAQKAEEMPAESFRAASEEWNRESYQQIVENSFKQVTEHPLSTFSIDVDTASYAIVRRTLMQQHRLPPADAVRIEEMINYFTYDYPRPTGDVPFSVNLEVAQAPWAMQNRLVRIGLQGKVLEERPDSNLVFLLDVSGSMGSANKLPLLKESLKLLVGQLTHRDRVAIVVYAGASGLVLPSTPGSDINAIVEALNRLNAGGSTNGGAGIQLAYRTAKEHFIEGGVNRVILATDGDFNVGVTNRGDLVRMVEEFAKGRIFLTVLGFGMSNLNDQTLEQLADKGNGNYGYIDTLAEARKMMVEQIGGTLVTIAKDVKIQVEFNPAQVQAYRLIGYENRLLAKEEFNDDTKDAGEIGAGHSVTALYEVVPMGVEAPRIAEVDDLRYQKAAGAATALADTDGAPADAVEEIVPTEVRHELLNVKLRYKEPEGTTSTKVEFPLIDSERSYSEASADFKFAASVATFGMLLRDSPQAGTASFDLVLELAQESVGDDPHGYRREFLDLVRQARALRQR